MPRAELSDHGSIQQVWIFCPGCNTHHALQVKAPSGPVWQFNWNYERPTFTPSLLCNMDHPELRCHSFIKDGKIQFLSDCYHELKNKTVDLPEVE